MTRVVDLDAERRRRRGWAAVRARVPGPWRVRLYDTCVRDSRERAGQLQIGRR